MSIRDQVRRLEQAGIDEDTIVRTLHLTHKQVRRYLQNPSEVLSQACREEIYYADIDEQRGFGHTLAQQYRTTFERVHAARRARTRTCNTPSEQELRQHVEALGLADACKALGCSHAYARDTLGMRREPPPKKEIRALLDKKLTYAAIGKLLGKTEDYVKQLAYREGWTARVNNKVRDDWPEILEYAAAHTVSEAARKYGVTRANIYYWRKKSND